MNWRYYTKRPLLFLTGSFIVGELVSHIWIHLQTTNELRTLLLVGLIAGIFMPAIFFALIQFVLKFVRQKQKEASMPLCSKKVLFWIYSGILASLIGAVCCFSADTHGALYDTLLSMQHTKDSTIRGVSVEGTVAKVEEKSKRWIYLKNASIRYWENSEDSEKLENQVDNALTRYSETQAEGEGVIVQLSTSDSESPRPLAGSQISVTGELSLFSPATNPGEFDSRNYYHSLGYDFCLRADDAAWTQKGNRYDPIAEGLWQLKAFLKAQLKRLMNDADEADYGVYCAVLFGDKSELDSDQKTLFQEQGIAHILSVSGLHISAVGLVTCGLLMRLTGSFALSGIAGSLTVLFYAAFTGNAVSTIRACVMYLILIIGRQKGRIYDMPTAAAAAALCLLFFQPLAIFQASMQLSFGAVLGISLVSEIFKRIPGQLSAKASMRAGRFFSVMGLSIAMLPVILYHYYQYPLYSLLLNQLVIPLAGLLIASPVAALVVSAVWPTAASVFLWAGHLVIRFYMFLCEVFGALPLSAQYAGRPAVWRIVLYFVLLCGIGIGSRWINERRKRDDEEDKKNRDNKKNKDNKKDNDDRKELNELNEEDESSDEKRKKRSGLIAAISLAIAYYLFGCFFLHADHYKGLEITVLDVGQGDGILLTLPDQTTILSDGGSSSRYQLNTSVLEPFLKAKGICRLDYVFVSHADNDHISGILGLMENNPEMIGTLLLPQSQTAEVQFEKLLTLAEEKQISVMWLSKGDQFSVQSASNISFEVLWPSETAASDDTNELSLVWRLSYGDFSMLFTGDLPGTYENQLEGLEPTTILKVAHHGSNYSTMERFLQYVQPQLAVISCSANNRYGHPGEQTLERLKNANVQSILVTKDCGAITIRTDGQTTEVTTYLEQ